MICHFKNFLFRFQVFNHFVLDYLIFAHFLHCKHFVCILLLYQVHLPKGAFTNDIVLLEVVERDIFVTA